MLVFGSSLSPFVRKTLAFAAEKGIAVEVKPVAIGSSDAEFLACSPFRKMPAFRDGDFAISDSTAIITYLEAKCPDPALLPAEAKSRARTIWYEEFADTILAACMGKMFFNRLVAPRFLGRTGDLTAADKAEKEELPPLVAYLERMLAESATPYLVDGRLTLADLAVASPFVNMSHLGVGIDGAGHPRTAAYIAAMHARPSFARLIAKEKAFLAR